MEMSYEGGDRAPSYEAADRPATYEAADRPATYQAADRPATYEAADRPAMYEGENDYDQTQDAESTQIVEAPPSSSADANGEQQDFVCTVCRKIFKREMNLVFHMTTHRPKQPKPDGEQEATHEPVTCEDCGKTFGTKYQAKKHYLRKHFKGERPFGCEKCGKRFVVKEDLTMHVKSCGFVYACSCGIRLCSLGALKQHCRHFSHEPASLEPQIQMNNGMLSMLPQHQQAGGLVPAHYASARPVGMGAMNSMAVPSMANFHAGMLGMRGPYAGQPLLANGMLPGFDPAAFGFNCLQSQGMAQQGCAPAQQLGASCALNIMAGAALTRSNEDPRV